MVAKYICIDPYIKELTMYKEYDIYIHPNINIFSYMDDNKDIHKLGINWLQIHFISKENLRLSKINEILDL